ncbi:MAG: leucyl aminopeptidase [Acidimicrobiales bacterium]
MSTKRDAAPPARVPVAVLARRVAQRVDVIGVPVFSDLSSPEGVGVLLDPVYLSQRRFEGRPGQAQAFPTDGGAVAVALGVGPKGPVGADDLRCAAAALARNAGNARHVATTLPAACAAVGGITEAQAVRATVEGFGLASYVYAGAPASRRTDSRAERLSVVSTAAGAQDALRRAQTAVEAAWRARDLVNSPANEMTPRELARLAVSDGEAAGLRVEVWDEKRIARERLGGLMGVAGGAAEPPRLIRMTYTPQYAERPAGRGAARRSRPPLPRIHLVGKGITFDSGGLSLKPAASMMTMKDDMGGAAAVICATIALAKLQVPAEVVAWVAATENMPSGTAIHPGDVITTRNAKTVEVLNTDAEGRLVLADALALAVEEHPDAVVDVATLTGGQRVALGDRVAAVMGSDSRLVERLVAAGRAVGEPCWELPLHPGYRKQLESDVADLKNVASGPAASAIMAGLFLGEFAAECPWAHLDIAGPAWSDSDDQWICRGATGWGTRTLIELVADW